jgi:hypothetical protein
MTVRIINNIKYIYKLVQNFIMNFTTTSESKHLKIHITLLILPTIFHSIFVLLGWNVILFISTLESVIIFFKKKKLINNITLGQ